MLQVSARNSLTDVFGQKCFHLFFYLDALLLAFPCTFQLSLSCLTSICGPGRCVGVAHSQKRSVFIRDCAASIVAVLKTAVPNDS